ncbi:type II secretion system protein [Gemmata sp. JC717]|uniref:type II secretion system protein n=1 Tax=Gemmata algarum TaxID=2975278 RepID=UPI0021BB19B9|nr:type II secretion system protein [Gemmata algarum]MDY3552767.1 type II secretion system protein [Gemmata algarum]
MGIFACAANGRRQKPPPTRAVRAPRGLTPSRTRYGFTLIELLGVSAIIGIRIGLLLPAVQSVCFREHGKKCQCHNGIRRKRAPTSGSSISFPHRTPSMGPGHASALCLACGDCRLPEVGQAK